MIVDERMRTYINSLDMGNTPFLEELEQYAIRERVPIIRREMQSFIKMFLAVNRPKRILEVGTAIGFSTLLMCEYGPEDLEIVTIENYEKRIPIAKENFRRAGREAQITLLEGDAGQILKELEEKIDKISVYARVSPEHKIRIVKAWQKKGNIVSMTGDGVNDAPALKQADIGVAMGITGTEVAKDAAAMILTDDNFATIIKAVTNGRNIYRNIKNAILFLLSGNMAGILSVLYTSLLGLPVPFAPVHLLFINLLTDSLPAIAIGVEPQDASLLEEKPRQASEGILSGETFRRIMLQGLCIAASTMAAFYIGNGKGAAMASTMAFATLTLARLFHGFNCRGNKTIFALGFTGNPYSILAFVSGSVLLGLVLFVPPLRGLFSVESLSCPAVIEIILLAALPTVVIQMVRGVRELKK